MLLSDIAELQKMLLPNGINLSLHRKECTI
jgi:hypothetical protein